MATYDTEAGRIKRARMIADALRESGNTPLPPSIRTGGRFDAPVSGWEYANKALQTVLGAYQARQADKSEKKLDEQDKAQLAEIMTAATAANRPDDPDGLDEVVPLEKPTTQADRQRALQAAVMRGQQFGGSSEAISNEFVKRDLFPQEYTLGADDIRMRGNKPIAVGMPRTVAPAAEDRKLETFVASTVPDATPKELELGRAFRARDQFKPGMVPYEKAHASGSGSGLTDVMLDPATLENAARDVIRMGPSAMFQYVSRAAQDKPTRDAINNMATKIARAAGMSNDEVARFRGRVQGELKSQKTLIDMKNAVESFEKLAKFNGERLLQLIEGVDTTGVPALEGAIRYAKMKGGNVDVAEFQSVLKTYQTEVARIISQPRLVGQLTDTQIEEMKKVVDGDASAPQLRRVISRLNLEMDIRAKSVGDQIAASGAALALPGSTTPTTTPPADVSKMSDEELLRALNGG